MNWIWSGLAPHPPIVVRDVGKERCKDVQKTIVAMQALATDILSQKPERVVIISPHTPRPNRGLLYWSSPELNGHFGHFGAVDAKLQFPNDLAFLDAFAEAYPGASPYPQQGLDHGAMVPLWFLHEAGWRGKTVVLGLPWADGEDLKLFGDALNKALRLQPVPTALLASGDMSHCLKPGAPSGYDPMGELFDHAFVDGLNSPNFQAIQDIPRPVSEQACQDVLASCSVVWHATHFCDDGLKVWNYEGPFGVGYTVARFSKSSLE